MWFRRDLRLSDNAALHAAVDSGAAVIPVHVASEGAGGRALGEVGRAWRKRSLASLGASLRERGSFLTTLAGSAPRELTALVRDSGSTVVHCTRDWSPDDMREETAVREALAEIGCELRVSEGQLLVVPDALLTGTGGPYRVFTPYHRVWTGAWRPAFGPPAPARIPGPSETPADDAAGNSKLPRESASTPSDPWLEWWTPGESGAHDRLARFLADAVCEYDTDRDRPDLRGTSELSPHLSFGEISPARVAREVIDRVGEDVGAPFLRQLAWRDFASHVLHHFPHAASSPLREEFAAFPWHADADGLEAWRAGMTGYPLVDAGMRQLATTGWMHNRVRLVCGSFLTKDLLVPWTDGLAHFAEALVDHDPAANAFNWQWVAGESCWAARIRSR